MFKTRADVVDMYQFNANNSQGGDGANFPAAHASGIKGVIHKASQYRHDTLYLIRKPKALAAGLYWGAYHFPTPSSVQAQVQLFLDSIGGPSADTFPFLDHESYAGYTFPLQSVINWMDAVDQKFGRPTGLYSGNVIKEQMPYASSSQYTFLKNHPFWLAQYNASPIMYDYNHHPLPWADFSSGVLWQFTGDGAGPGPHSVPGIGNGVDVSTFITDTDDDLTHLDEWWKTGKVALPPAVA